MTPHMILIMLIMGFLSVPTVALSQEQTTTVPPQTAPAIQGTLPAFPPSDKCSTSTPCRNVAGEVVKIEESYWIRQSDGTQTHVRVKPGTKIESRVKVGDNIAAQLTSTGDAEAVLQLHEKPTSAVLPVPKKELGDLR
ncbi:MAG: hypothetical protein ACREIM_02265 [Nitrospiraceae bacterium]